MKKYSANSSFYNGNDFKILTSNPYNNFDPMLFVNETSWCDIDYSDCSGGYSNYCGGNDGYNDYEDYMDEKEMDEDYESMKNMYPETCKRILKYVEEECNRLDYEGSALYDEMLDKELIEIITERIYERLMDEDKSMDESEEVEEEIDMTKAHGDKWQKNMVKVMLLNDIYGRRSRRCYRRNRRCRPTPYQYPCYNRRRCYPTPYQYPHRRMRYQR